MNIVKLCMFLLLDNIVMAVSDMQLLINEDDLLLNQQQHITTFEQQQQPPQNIASHITTFGLEGALQGLSYETIHRILRDENEPLESIKSHVLVRREIPEEIHYLQLAQHNLTEFNLLQQLTVANCQLTKLDLSWNSLFHVNLSNCITLREVDLSHNALTQLPIELLAEENSQLLLLNLNDNFISDGEAPNNAQLHELHLSGNNIAQLSNVNLSKLTALETLDLSCNRLSKLETAYFPQRMHNLKHLNLAHNQLDSISRENFYNLLSLNTLLLRHNNITDVDYETFLALPNLQFLDLSHNQLRGESIRALQGIPDLVHLSIAYNPHIGSYMQEFVASWSLKELDASGTGLCRIPAALAQSVRTLKLTHNWIKIINCGDLDSYPLLQYLEMSYSHIEEVEDDALGRLEILEVLFLDNNALSKIPFSLPTSMEHLFLQNNRIMDIHVQAFQSLSNLKTLDLSGNQLLYLPALPLPKLLTLNLQASGLKGLSQAIVHTLPHLRDLLLENNPIKCSDLFGIAEWASPCRLTERLVNEQLPEIPVNNNYNADAANIGQQATKIDLKQQFQRLTKSFEKFHSSTCSRNALSMSKPQTTQPTCAIPTILLTETRKRGINHQQATTSTSTTSTTPLLIAASLKAFQPHTTVQSLQNDDFAVVSLLTTTTETIPATTTTTITTSTTTTKKLLQKGENNGEKEKEEIITTPRTVEQQHIKSVVVVVNDNQKTEKLLSNNIQNNNNNTNNNNNNNSTNNKVVRLRLPKNSKRSKLDFNIISQKQQQQQQHEHEHEHEQQQRQSNKQEPEQQQDEEKEKYSNIILNDSLASIQNAQKLLPTILTTPLDSLAPPHKHQHQPLQLHLKDRHLIGTPLLTHQAPNELVESVKLKIPFETTTTPRTPTTTRSTIITTLQTESTKFKEQKKKNTLNMKKMLITSKHSTVNTPLHQHTEVYTFEQQQKQQQQQHKQFVESLLEYKPKAVVSNSKTEQWLDTRKNISSGHPALVILLSSLLFLTLLLGLMHVYRCEMPWQRHLPQPRPHQRQFNDDDVHSFLHFHNNTQYNSPLHNLHVHELQQTAHTTTAATTTTPISAKTINYTMDNNNSRSNNNSSSHSSSTSSSGCNSNASNSQASSIMEEDTFYLEMASDDILQTNKLQSDLLPMELLNLTSSKNEQVNMPFKCRSLEMATPTKTKTDNDKSAASAKFNGTVNTTTTATITEVECTRPKVGLTSLHSSLIRNETSCGLAEVFVEHVKTTSATKMTPSTRRFDLW